MEETTTPRTFASAADLREHKASGEDTCNHTPWGTQKEREDETKDYVAAVYCKSDSGAETWRMVDKRAILDDTYDRIVWGDRDTIEAELEGMYPAPDGFTRLDFNRAGYSYRKDAPHWRVLTKIAPKNYKLTLDQVLAAVRDGYEFDCRNNRHFMPSHYVATYGGYDSDEARFLLER